MIYYLEGMEVDVVNDGAGDGSLVAADSVQQGLQPPGLHLAVDVINRDATGMTVMSSWIALKSHSGIKAKYIKICLYLYH